MARRRKKKNNYKFLVIVFLIIAGVIVYQNFFVNKSNQKILMELGYTEEQAVSIVNKLTTIPEEYNDLLANYVTYNDFVYEDLERYQNYKNTYPTLSNEEVIKGVSLEFDSVNVEYSDDALAFTNEKYYKLENLSRYLKYSSKNDELSNSDVIREVHAYLDKEFYVDYISTDLSKGILLIANKFNYLGDYEPTDLVVIPSEYGGRGLKASKVTVDAYIEMYKAIASEGMSLKVNSAYRSYSRQKTLYNGYVSTNGFNWAEKWSARPGFSEHQTGLALDIVSKNSNFDNFEDTKEYEWLVNNSYKYGFILRYPSDDYYLTGYNFESWHFRYVGVDVATKIYNEGLTFEEYYEYYVK